MTTKALPSTTEITLPQRTTIRGVVFGLRVRSASVRGACTTYVDEGDGPVVVLLHGAPITSLGFQRVIHELKGTHRVVAPDFPAFGGSEAPRGFGGTLDEYAEFVVEFIDTLGLKDVVLFGNDSSGCIGLAAATRLAPGLLRGMVVADTVPIPLTGAAWFVRLVLRYVVASRLMRWLHRHLNLLPWMVGSLAPWLEPFSRAERRELIREFDTFAKREQMLNLFEQMAVDGAFMRTTADRVRTQLSTLPTLILYGQFDPMRIIGGVARLRALLPNSHVAIVAKEEHFPILSSGAKVGSIMRDWMNTRLDPLDG